MAVARDLSSLPRSRDVRDGLTPDAEPRFIQSLVEDWATQTDDNKPTAMGTPFRHSDAGKCARALSYTAAGIPASDPMDLSGVWNVTLGSLLHEKWQDALQARFPDAEVEVTCRTVGADGSGHIDAVIRHDDRVTAYELKTIGGFGYKLAVGAKSKGKAAEGPKPEHIMQAALSGLAVGADEVVIGYLAKEAVSVNEAERFGVTELERFCCEWTFTREQFEGLAVAEAERVARVLELVADGKLAPRRVPSEMPKGAEVVDPSTGAWKLDSDGDTVDAGSTWQCNYCKFQTLCTTTEAGIIPLSSLSTGEAA